MFLRYAFCTCCTEEIQTHFRVYVQKLLKEICPAAKRNLNVNSYFKGMEKCKNKGKSLTMSFIIPAIKIHFECYKK